MKTSIAAFCILVFGVTMILTGLKNKTQELIETTNKYVIEHKKSTYKNIKNHRTHNDIVISEGKMICKKTQSLYRIK